MDKSDASAYLGQLQYYLHHGFKNVNGAVYPQFYTNPQSKVYLDPGSSNAGYQPLRNKDVYLNPDAGTNGSQAGALNTLFHEYAHTDQPSLSTMFNFINPTYRLVNKLDFPYYSDKTNSPGAQEVLATMRAGDAMSYPGKNVWNSSMGKDVLEQMGEMGYPEDNAKQLLNSAMFPKLNFAGPVHPYQEPSGTGLSDIFNSNNIVP